MFAAAMTGVTASAIAGDGLAERLADVRALVALRQVADAAPTRARKLARGMWPIFIRIF